MILKDMQVLAPYISHSITRYGDTFPPIDT